VLFDSSEPTVYEIDHAGSSPTELEEAMPHPSSPHATELEIRRAQEGIKLLRQEIDALNGLRPRLAIAFYAHNNRNVLDQLNHASQQTKRTIARVFGPESAQTDNILKGTDLLDNLKGLSWEEMNNQVETNIAAAMDALEQGINILEQRIVALEGRTAVISAQRPVSSNPIENNPEIFILRPSFYGMSVDLKALWRKLTGKV
jgi:hypothetical protein